jgi:hypothetical protein
MTQETDCGIITDEQMAWFYKSLEEIIWGIKDFETKSQKDIEGEVYTALRREMTYECISSNKNFPFKACQLFCKTKKIFKSKFYYALNVKQRKQMEIVFNSLMNRRLSEKLEDNEDNIITSLELLLTMTRATVRKSDSLAKYSGEIRKGLDNIQNILDGKEEEEDVE